MKIENFKLLILSGPTASGKTALAVKLAQEFNGELLNADSRQLYQGMDIGTGKDHPQNIPLHLIDIIRPDQSFSVAEYHRLALKKISEIHSKNKLPVVVGGTGQYIDSFINPRPTFAIHPNKFLRFFLNKLTIFPLQKIYQILDKQSFESLNNSEKNNPHRLIRKIEIKISKLFRSVPSLSSKRGQGRDFDVLHLSLTAPNEYLYKKIDQRVDSRLKSGLFNEIKTLLKIYSWHHPGLNTLAYKEFRTGFSPQNIERWRYDEHAYARRQKTWFAKYRPDHFIDITSADPLPAAQSLVRRWYNQYNETTKN